MISINIFGLDKLMSHLGGIKSGLASTISKGMKEAAFVVEGAAKRQITSGANRAIRTGYLRASIGVQSVMPFRATVIAGAHYGIYIHQGTKYMRARPFMAAGLKDAVPEIEKIFGRRIKTLVETI